MSIHRNYRSLFLIWFWLCIEWCCGSFHILFIIYLLLSSEIRAPKIGSLEIKHHTPDPNYSNSPRGLRYKTNCFTFFSSFPSLLLRSDRLVVCKFVSNFGKFYQYLTRPSPAIPNFPNGRTILRTAWRTILTLRTHMHCLDQTSAIQAAPLPSIGLKHEFLGQGCLRLQLSRYW